MISKKRQKQIIEIIQNAHFSLTGKYFDIDGPGPEMWSSDEKELFDNLTEWEYNIKENLQILFDKWNKK